MISINHSHHPIHLIKSGHEFRFRGKYFCTGCYGILIGTIISVIIGISYIVNGFNTLWGEAVLLLIPLCFIPIILRYKLSYKFPSSAKLLANCLLPIGSCLSLIYTDFLYHNWILNVLVVLLIITAAFLRGVIAQKDNKLK
ncbi:hypothetical protein CEE45_08660 [Candidatus Heimdallarchaeota archaeon B3_Heim]|nr:MAG: hypothetical protein CEE45_08660 [Candidatus Heimdallarchaeota archaeon B3_Heim]